MLFKEIFLKRDRAEISNLIFTFMNKETFGMPEGSEIRVIADSISKGIGTIFEGAEIIENIPNTQHRYSKKLPKNWNIIANNRWKIINVRTKGKLILIDIEVLETKQQYVLLATLGMSGDFIWNGINNKHCRYAFLKINGENLSFCDIRCFGTLRIVFVDESKILESKIGHDLLQSPMNEEQWKKLQNHSKIKNKEIKIALMEQNIFSGLGNIYAAETLYEVGINPKYIVNEVDPYKWNQINLTAHNILQKAYALNGSSVKDYTFDGKKGQAQTILKVYGKKLCPQNHKIETIQQKERTTWYCPICQK